MRYLETTLLVLLLLCSCSHKHNEAKSYYTTRNIQIEDYSMTQYMDSANCKIEIATELKMPSNFRYMDGKKLLYENGCFFLMDSKYNNTIFVFDSVGNYINKLGERGRAKNEYIKSPTDFFVDSNNGNVHVFERDSRRIIIFTKDGNYKETIQLNYWPYSIGYTSSGNYLASFNYKKAGDGLQLGVIGLNEEVVNPILYLQNDFDFVTTHNTSILSDGLLYHIPNFSDSIMVFCGDTVKEVIKLNFPYKEIPNEIKKLVAKSEMDNYIAFRGINSISNYYETNSFVNFSYSLSHVKFNCLIDKRNKKQYHSSGGFFQGVFPGHTYCVKGDYILWLITQDDVDDLLSIMKFNSDNYDSDAIFPHVIVKDIMRKKYKLPLILKITPCHDVL